jgi:hypothetical protein
MANEQYAFLKSGDVPSRDQLQQAIDRAGFDLKLNPEYQPKSDAGFVPCSLNGSDSGVEMYFDDSDELIDSFRELLQDQDCCISFRWGGDMAECACAMVVSYALAESFGAIVSYEGEPPSESLQQFREETESVVADAAKGT